MAHDIVGGPYHLVIQHSHGKSSFLIGKPSINGPFSMAMLVITRGYFRRSRAMTVVNGSSPDFVDVFSGQKL